MGTDSYYRGVIANTHARFLEAQRSPLPQVDFESYSAEPQTPLTVTISLVTLYNTGLPTQGMSTLAILALFDRLSVTQGEGFTHTINRCTGGIGVLKPAPLQSSCI
ncbi:gamma-glutamyltransferase [Sulfitobacter sp. SK011]|uniref:gamma-glutamyltransferase n=1 Tax=Sulfitobacter sp. SK011 TaxID=1389004 RepID=UPI000E0A4797